MFQELERLAPFVAGPAAAVFVLLIFAYFNRKDHLVAADKFERERADAAARLENKDNELRRIATESIGAITQLSAIGSQNQQ